MATMTAVVLTRHGGPDALQVRRDWPRPAADAGQVLVEVRAAAVNNTDIWTREGSYGLPGDPDARAGWRGPLAFPRVQGGDVAGRIVAVGEDVDPGRVGQRVLLDPAIYADGSLTAPPVGLLGSERDGGFAEYVAWDAPQAHDVTASPLTDGELAALPIAYGTALGMLERAAVREQENVVVTGASGGVGLALVQLAAARGARVVAITSGAKATDVEHAGALETIDRNTDDVAGTLARRCPEGVDVVADVAGGPMLTSLLPLVRDDGRWVIAGAVAGHTVDLDLRRLYLHNISLIGSSMHTREHFARLVDMAREGMIAPVIASRHPLQDIASAQEHFKGAERSGKVVLEVSDGHA
jgi:NADPH:quinone reductase-like Zn-dependent oxidoreductase